MTTPRQVVTDEQLGLYSAKERELFDRLRFGIGGVNFKDTMAGLQYLIEGNSIGSTLTVVANPLSSYYKINDLIVIGPREWEKKAMRSQDKKNRNLLGLQPGWCPTPEIPWTVDQLRQLVKICQTSEWNTTPILWLALPEVAGRPTSLESQYFWWGVAHDNMPAGILCSDLNYSNWAIRDKCPWVFEPAITEPTWMIGYGEPPAWTMRRNWQDQQAVTSRRKLAIATASRDALMLDLVALATGKRFRTVTWARTSTFPFRYPVHVHFYASGLCLNDRWPPEHVFDVLGAAVEGVPDLGL